MQNKSKSSYTWEEKYEKLDIVGEGGNGIVFKVKDKCNNEYVLKQLKSKSEEKKFRFKNEINLMIKFSKKTNVIPILDYCEEKLWYVMPIAIPIMQYIKDNDTDIEEIVNGIIQISDALSILHNEGSSHRDIKPDNILIYNNKYCLGDFGLAEFLGNSKEFTRDDKALGAIFTIAPEMKRNPKDSDGKSADVFSLAKTLWMLLKRDNRGFDGEYSFIDEDIRLRSIEKLKDEYLVELDELLVNATKNNPKNRPTIIEFKNKLEEWIGVHHNSEKVQENEWKFLQKYLFIKYNAKFSCWDNINEIVEILNLITNTRVCNHMFFPNGGGFDLKSVKVAPEKGCVYLYFDYIPPKLIKPKNLYFINFKDNIKCDCFFLELDKLEPIIDLNECFYEELIEDLPGHYISSENASYGVYDYELGNELPEGWKTITRYCKGNFVLSLSNSYYDLIKNVYDGRHNDTNFYYFFKYMESINDCVKNIDLKITEYIKEKKMPQISLDERKNIIDNLLNENFDKNPFKYDKKIYNNVKVTRKKITYDSIKDKCFKMCFKDILDKSHINNNQNEGLFYINIQSIHSKASDFGNMEELILCKNGYFQEVKFKNNYFQKVDLNEIEKDIYWFKNRENAYKVLDKCRSKIIDLCKNKEFENAEIYVNFNVVLEKFKKPQHLFSKNEVENLIINADDRVDNVVVIDENGYVNILTGDNICRRNSYPVRFEKFEAKNNNVGKYLDVKYINEYYIMLLEGWLSYLKTESPIYKSYLESSNLELEDNFIEIENNLIIKIENVIQSKK